MDEDAEDAFRRRRNLRPNLREAISGMTRKAHRAETWVRDGKSAALLEPLATLATGGHPHLSAEIAGDFLLNGRPHAMQRFHFAGPSAGADPIRLGLFG